MSKKKGGGEKGWASNVPGGPHPSVSIRTLDEGNNKGFRVKGQGGRSLESTTKGMHFGEKGNYLSYLKTHSTSKNIEVAGGGEVWRATYLKKIKKTPRVDYSPR